MQQTFTRVRMPRPATEPGDPRWSKMSQLFVNGVGTLAAVCSMTSFLPQVIKIAKERDASSVSLRMYVVTVTGFSLWLIYGLMLKSWPLVVSNAVSLALSGAVLALKLRYGDGEGARPSP